MQENGANVMPKSKQWFCSKPFQWFEVTHLHTRGEVYVCCPSWLDTPIGNLQYQSVEEIWNGEKAQEIRRSILDGSFKYCSASRCAFLQTLSGPVENIEDVKDESLQEIIKNGLTVLPYGPRDIICTYDRSCNLSCPSCRTEIIVESRDKQEILDIQSKLQNGALKDAHLLYITGSGDPFGSPFFRKWLQTMKPEDMPSLREIRLHTNAQLWTPAMWDSLPEDIWPFIKSTEISIDAASPETYAINRRGGTFAKLLENLEFIGTLRKNGPLESVTISMVVQANNFREMPDFVRLGQRFSFDVVYFSQLVNWGTFSDKEFSRRAVHLPGHPRHAEFVRLLQNEIFKDTRVCLGNLSTARGLTRWHSKTKSILSKVFFK
jgi:MoaA/NifB/PqqE/SkfB family radical SAM enzyme